MNISVIPEDLKSRKQWVVWRSVVKDGKVTKPPYQPHNPQQLADVMNPETWASFDDAVQSAESNSAIVQGVGFVFTDEDEFFGIDIDDEAKVAEEDIPARRWFVGEILKRTNTYTEISPSGNGLHIIGRGRLPAYGRRSSKLGVEIYASRRYLTFTGNVCNGKVSLEDSQDLADFMFTNFQPQSDVSLDDIETNRRLDLSDEEVIREATNFHPSFAPRYNGQVGCEPGEWSETFMMIVGVLDQITGKVEQLQRLVMQSPMVQSSPPSAAGESRSAKAQRNFTHVLRRVRGNNTIHMSRVAHGRMIAETLERTKTERAKAAVEEILKQSEDAFSKDGIELLRAFPIDPKNLTLRSERSTICATLSHGPGHQTRRGNSKRYASTLCPKLQKSFSLLRNRVKRTAGRHMAK